MLPNRLAWSPINTIPSHTCWIGYMDGSVFKERLSPAKPTTQFSSDYKHRNRTTGDILWRELDGFRDFNRKGGSRRGTE